ncbi:MAG: hypothetical protein J6S41_01400 [Clostridia bacterium]|nr:hypothetical protein [Clostridia bacterium]
MALGDNEGVSTTMLVSPTSGNVGASYAYPAPIIYGGNGGGMGFGGGDWGSLITLFLLFGLFGGGFGGFGGFGMGGMMGAGMMGGMFGMDFLYPWLNNSQNINDGFRAQQIGTDIGSIRDGVQGIAQQMCECCGNMRYDMATGFNGVERSVTGAQNALAQQMYANQIAELERSYAAQTATAQGFNGTQAGLADLKFTIAQEECATRNASAMNARDIIDATTRGNQAILDKLCQLELDGYKRDNDNLRSQLQFANMQASQTAQTADLRASQLAATSALVQELRQCPIPSQPVYGNQPIFTCAQNVAASNYGCGCNGYVA